MYFHVSKNNGGTSQIAPNISVYPRAIDYPGVSDYPKSQITPTMYFLWKKIFQMGVHGLRRNDGGTFETKLSKMSQFTLFVSFYSSISIYPNCLKFPTYLKNHQRIFLPLYRQVILIQFLVTRRVFKFKNAFLLCAQTFSLVEPFYLGI